MSRMGDTIKNSRIKYGMTEKQLAKKTGLAESFIKEVEAGKRIPSDDQARRILKACGATDVVGTEIDTANEPEVEIRPRPRPYIIPVEKKEELKEEERAQASNDAWLDALGGVVKRVPVMDENGLVLDHILEPVIGGKIEGGVPDKVIYYRCPDDALRGYRIYAGDLLLTVPAKVPVDDAIMLLEHDGKRLVRKVTKLDGAKLMLQSYDREFKGEKVELKNVLILGLCVRMTRRL